MKLTLVEQARRMDGYHVYHAFDADGKCCGIVNLPPEGSAADEALQVSLAWMALRQVERETELAAAAA